MRTIAMSHTVNCLFLALQGPGGLYKFVRGFRWAYKQRGLYPRGLIIGCIVWFTGRWAYNWGGGGGGEGRIL